MKKLTFLAAVIIAGLLQVSLLSAVSLWGVRPDLLMIMVVAAGLFFDFKFALTVGVAAGAWKDVFGVSAYGIHALSMAILALAIAVFVKRMSGDTAAVRMAVVAAAVVCHGVMVQVFYALGGNAVPAGIALRIIAVEAVYTVLVFALLQGPVALLDASLGGSRHPGLVKEDEIEDMVEDEVDRDGLLY